MVSASDSDDGDNGRISIFIIGGDPRSQFKVNDVSLQFKLTCSQSEIEISKGKSFVTVWLCYYSSSKFNIKVL